MSDEAQGRSTEVVVLSEQQLRTIKEKIDAAGIDYGFRFDRADFYPGDGKRFDRGDSWFLEVTILPAEGSKLPKGHTCALCGQGHDWISDLKEFDAAIDEIVMGLEDWAMMKLRPSRAEMMPPK
jgi:hypothetical protein